MKLKMCIAILFAGFFQSVFAQTKNITTNMNPIYYKTTTVDGLDIFYIEAGKKENPAIVLLHGFPSSSFMYRNLIDELKDNYYVIAPTYPGFGLSSSLPITEFKYSFELIADIMKGFLDKVSIQKASFFVQDYGGPVGFRFLAKHPELLQCLIIQNANAYIDGLRDAQMPLFDTTGNLIPKTKKEALDLMTLKTTRFQYEDGVADISKIDPSIYYLDQFFLEREGNKEIQYALLKDYKSNVELYPRFHNMFREKQPPTLVVWGENDRFFSKSGALRYGGDLKTIEYHFYPTGHFALEEFGKEIASDIDAFLKLHLK